MAAEVLEGCFSSCGFPLRIVESKPQALSPAYITRPRKEPRYHTVVESSRGSICHREIARDSESFLKDQYKIFCSQSLLLARGGRAEWTRDA